jgi:lipid-A-disaccharide synthase
MKILISALEPSSNLHLKELVKYLDNSIELSGIFEKSIGEPNYDISDMAIMGFVNAIKKLPFLMKVNNDMVKLSKDADIVLLMDGSGFNLPLAKKIKNIYPNKTIIYYILPQAWAWKKGRIKKIEKNCDILCSILPFEEQYYTNKNKIKYVGHPLLDELKIFKKELIKSDIIAFMPGSRKSEIEKNMPIFKGVAKEIKNKKFVIVIPSKFDKKFIDEVYGDISLFEISNNTNKTLYEAEFAFICSGTATLEAALIGTPFVLSYIANPIDYFIGSKLVKLKYIGLANIFFEQMNKDPIHKEYIQDDVSVENLLEGYCNIDKEDFLKSSKILRDYLGSGSSQNVANIINERVIK